MSEKLQAFLQRSKTELVIAGSSAVAVMASPSFAADGDIDTTKALLYIAGGIAAAAVVGGAMFGLVALIGASKKAQRAGT